MPMFRRDCLRTAHLQQISDAFSFYRRQTGHASDYGQKSGGCLRDVGGWPGVQSIFKGVCGLGYAVSGESKGDKATSCVARLFYRIERP